MRFLLNNISFSLIIFVMNVKNILNFLDRHFKKGQFEHNFNTKKIIENVFNVMGFFLLCIINNYKQDAFDMQVNIGRYMSQKTRNDNLNFL